MTIAVGITVPIIVIIVVIVIAVWKRLVKLIDIFLIHFFFLSCKAKKPLIIGLY